MLLCSSSYVFGLVDILVLYSFICASRSILLIDDEKITKIPANNIGATLAWRLIYLWVYRACVIDSFQQ